MEEVREMAESYYKAWGPEVQTKAEEFYNSMDSNGDGKVDLEEFLTFMKDEGHAQMRNSSFFKMLGATGDGGLGFMDVMTVFYIIKSGRPFCDSCGEFIPGIYFSCLTCFNHPQNSYNLCNPCHKSNKSQHNHAGPVIFLDNYTMLAGAKRRPQPPTAPSGQDGYVATELQVVGYTRHRPTHHQSLRGTIPQIGQPTHQRLRGTISQIGQPTHQHLRGTIPQIGQPTHQRLRGTIPQIDQPTHQRLHGTNLQIGQPTHQRLRGTNPQIVQPTHQHLRLGGTIPQTANVRPTDSQNEIVPPTQPGQKMKVASTLFKGLNMLVTAAAAAATLTDE